MDNELKSLLELDNVTYINCDLTNPNDFDKLDTNYDYVYHLAAINGTKNFYEMPQKVLRVNVLSSINLLDWYIQTKCKKILFTSSSETYAGTMRTSGFSIPTPEDVPLCVDDILNPRWSYGGSKIIGELLFLNYSRMNNFDMSIIRYHNIYGGRMGYDHVIPEFIVRLLKKEDPFKIFGSEETRAFCYIDDAIKATQLVMENANTNHEIINIGNDTEEISIMELAEKLYCITNNYPNLELMPAPLGSVQRRCPDLTKIKKLTGYEPMIDLNDGLKRTFEWYTKNTIL
jgi:nucleoside-diphosphate-sugar epimerase